MSRLEVRKVNRIAGQLVVDPTTDRLLAGVGHNAHRAWVFPLNTPKGINVLQEYPFDHPFHNGVFVGQGNVKVDGQVVQFWSPQTNWRQPDNPIFRDIGVLKYGEEAASTEELTSGFKFTYETVWCDENEQPVLEEVREFVIADGGDATLCRVSTTKTASYRPVVFEATKHAAVGVRIQPQLLPDLGGEVVASRLGKVRRGRADEVANDQACDHVAYEADVVGVGKVGVALSIYADAMNKVEDRDGPWFIRDYGLATVNPTMHQALTLDVGDSWTAGLQVAAYDGEFSVDRADRWAAANSVESVEGS